MYTFHQETLCSCASTISEEPDDKVMQFIQEISDFRSRPASQYSLERSKACYENFFAPADARSNDATLPQLEIYDGTRTITSDVNKSTRVDSSFQAADGNLFKPNASMNVKDSSVAPLHLPHYRYGLKPIRAEH